jgi:hypothetical protein
MAFRRIVAGSTSQLIEFPIYDSSSTTGALKTGLTYSSMTCSYYIEGASGTVQVTPVSMTMGTWTTKGFIAVDGTNTPGLYQFGIPNAAIAAGATQVTLYFTASGCVPIVIPIELTSVTNYPVNATQWNGTNVSSPATAGIPDVNIKNMNNVAATSITAVNANQGTTQPLNFTGTGSSALVKVDVTDIATAAVATGSAQLGVNLVNIAGSAVSTSSAQLGVNVVTQANIDFGALQKTSLNAATPVASLSGDLTATMKTSVTTAATAATPTVTAGAVSAGAINNAAFNADVASTAYASNTLAQMIYKFFDNAFTGYSDGSTFTSNGLLDRLTKAMWILRNQIAITDATGAGTIYKDDNATSALSVSITDNSTTTTRTRAA